MAESRRAAFLYHLVSDWKRRWLLPGGLHLEKRKYHGRLRLKHPTYTAEKTASWAELGGEYTDSSSISQLVDLIEKISYVEPKLEQTDFLRQVKEVGETQI